MYNFCKDVAGAENGRRFFPFVTTIFLFVLVNALMNLIRVSVRLCIMLQKETCHY